uniref:Uncharacterized protein n=1 Tax=viral metagenome TaxID=1070528 RepID=A0A6M3M804_9ZZZZ
MPSKAASSAMGARLYAEIQRREELAKRLKDLNIVAEFTEEWDNTLDLLRAIRDDNVEFYMLT